MNLLKELELLKLVRVHRQNVVNQEPEIDLVSKYKGAMTAQHQDEIDSQLKELRDEWS